MDRLYAKGSSLDRGTLLHLRNLIDRRNISKNVSGRFNATINFIETITDCHIVAAAMNHFGMEKETDQPSKNHLPPLPLNVDAATKWSVLTSIMGDIINRYVFIKDFANIAAPNQPQQ